MDWENHPQGSQKRGKIGQNILILEAALENCYIIYFFLVDIYGIICTLLKSKGLVIKTSTFYFYLH